MMEKNPNELLCFERAFIGVNPIMDLPQVGLTILNRHEKFYFENFFNWMYERTIGNIPGPSRIKPKVLMLSRNKAIKRNIINENEFFERIKDLFKKIYPNKEFEFVSIDPGVLSLPEQIKLFRGISFLISIHGGALSYTYFLPKGITLLEIFPAYLDVGMYGNIAESVEVNYYHYYMKSKDIVKIRYKNEKLEKFNLDDVRREKYYANVDYLNCDYKYPIEDLINILDPIIKLSKIGL
jgi:hypothetical protein